MKTITLLFLMMGFWTFNIYGQNSDIKGLLEKPETRTEIFNSILNDHEVLTEFMKALEENDHAMMMMRHSSLLTDNDGEMVMTPGQIEMVHENQMGDQGKQCSSMCDNMDKMSDSKSQTVSKKPHHQHK